MNSWQWQTHGVASAEVCSWTCLCNRMNQTKMTLGYVWVETMVRKSWNVPLVQCDRLISLRLAELWFQAWPNISSVQLWLMGCLCEQDRNTDITSFGRRRDVDWLVYWRGGVMYLLQQIAKYVSSWLKKATPLKAGLPLGTFRRPWSEEISSHVKADSRVRAARRVHHELRQLQPQHIRMVVSSLFDLFIFDLST